jgi:hypothetical protein
MTGTLMGERKSSIGWWQGSAVGMAAFTRLAFSYGKIAYEVTEYPMRTPSRTIDTESTAAYAHLRNDVATAMISGKARKINRGRSPTGAATKAREAAARPYKSIGMGMRDRRAKTAAITVTTMPTKSRSCCWFVATGSRKNVATR